MKATQNRKCYFLNIEYPPFGPRKYLKGGQLDKAYGIKVRCYGENVGET